MHKGSRFNTPSALLSPGQPEDEPSITRGSSSDLVHLSREASPFQQVAVDSQEQVKGEQAVAGRNRSPSHHREQSEGRISEDDSYKVWALDDDPNEEDDMPSDLRPSANSKRSHAHAPLLSNGKAGDDSDRRSGSRSPSLHSRPSRRLREKDPEALAKAATRKRYTYAACFLLLSLISFTIQTETAVYIQHNLKWNKAYCMLYFTHGSWSLLWPTQLLILRLNSWSTPWRVFWRRHVGLIRSTAQMVEHQKLNIPPEYSRKSPVPYFLRTMAFVTCALTVAGGSWYVAVDLTTASDLTAIYNCSAFFAYAFAVPMLHEKLRWSKVLSVAIAIAGVLIVAYGDKPAKHGSKSGGGAGGPNAPDNDEASNRALGNIVIGVGSVLYGFYEVLYKKVACPPEGCSPHRGMVFANVFGSLIGVFTLTVLWIPIPILHVLGIEKFELPHGEAAWMLVISVFANATFSGAFLTLISLTSPVLSSVAALLTIFLVAVTDQLLPPPMYSPLSFVAVVGGSLIIAAFLLLSWATYREMQEEQAHHAPDMVEQGSDDDSDY
ncbi:hypothetical protein K431DRAFT_280489 [Polychaeton citri CBS 116435]|uniref:EamA domain-containing protein n=1 Tax=Polychaeton citri CBS 116435 TaxID=1314669 RepID=A0A9P4URL8_9PEZI|nr:hypothetical protein K431DRAFT_280489 [Polychaeton citri CBS 116435]